MILQLIIIIKLGNSKWYSKFYFPNIAIRSAYTECNEREIFENICKDKVLVIRSAPHNDVKSLIDKLKSYGVFTDLVVQKSFSSVYAGTVKTCYLIGDGFFSLTHLLNANIKTIRKKNYKKAIVLYTNRIGAGYQIIELLAALTSEKVYCYDIQSKIWYKTKKVQILKRALSSISVDIFFRSIITVLKLFRNVRKK